MKMCIKSHFHPTFGWTLDHSLFVEDWVKTTASLVKIAGFVDLTVHPDLLLKRIT